jgi:hypothetical protein
MTRHFSHIRLVEGLTFIICSKVSNGLAAPWATFTGCHLDVRERFQAIVEPGPET